MPIAPAKDFKNIMPSHIEDLASLSSFGQRAVDCCEQIRFAWPRLALLNDFCLSEGIELAPDAQGVREIPRTD
jgi:hypothetical protein